MKSLSSAILAAAAIAGASPAIIARDYTTVDFGNASGYKSIGVYDTWERSPFRIGTLKGNYAIVSSEGLPTTDGYTAPATVLGAQRSRFGSNTSGARIDLTDPFMLTPEMKYVHVVMQRPVKGRVMLIGIGGSSYFPSNGNDVEQFWETSLNNVKPGEWCDAVFAVKGFHNSSVSSLVVVPECESPHMLAADFPFYIAGITVNDSPVPLILKENYPVAAGSRREPAAIAADAPLCPTSQISFRTGDAEATTYDVSQAADHLLYRQETARCFTAMPGQEVSIAVDCANPSMADAYVYVDWNADGQFDYSLYDNGTPADGSEIVAYSYAENRDSRGNFLTSRPAAPSLPSFRIPADTRPGVYRMRIKIDSNSTDPAGSDDIISAGGSMTDLMLNIHPGDITVDDHQLNGEVLSAEGAKLNKMPAKMGRDLPIILAPEKGFRPGGVTVRYGHLSGDSIVMENPQYFEKEFIFDSDRFTIPAQYVAGDILLMGRMIEQSR